MNIYEKLAKARVELQSAGIKKGGENTFSKYEYFTLDDFLPVCNKLADKHKFLCAVRFDQEMAVLSVINAEVPEEHINFTSPMSTATLKGCHEVQNLGAVQTYIRRYLYMTAFEIVEHDVLDETLGADEAPKKQTVAKQTKSSRKPDEPKKMNQEQIKKLQSLAISQFGKDDGILAYKNALNIIGAESSAKLLDDDFSIMRQLITEFNAESYEENIK